MGLRSYKELCRPAFLGAMEQALPWLHLGFCSVVEPILGGEDVFGGEASEVGRWHKV